MILETFIGLILVIAFGCIIYCRWNYGKLESLGIPVVKPFLIFGSNYKEPYIYVQNEDIRRQQEYGQVYGAYDGRSPVVYISDPAIIRLITTVDFDHFPNRNYFLGGMFEHLLDALKDDKWRTVRSALTPIFSSAKVKQLSRITYNFSEDYAETLFKSNNLQKIVLKEFCAPLILEALAKGFCGIDIPNAADPGNVFITQMKVALFHEQPEDDWKSLIPKILPIISKFLPSPCKDSAMDFFVAEVKNILKVREELTGSTDFADAASVLVDMMKKVKTDEKYASLGINEMVVITQAWELFLGSYSGIRDTFEFLMYELAVNQQCQEKVHAEIDKSNGDFTLELPYLQASIQEVTRLHASFTRPERICVKDWKSHGLRIPKGVLVVFPVAAVHRNPDFYPEPDKFDPERFMPGVTRDQYTYLAFGQGPRSCLGQRFALQMLKVMAFSFLKRFKVIQRPDTKLQAKIGCSIAVAYYPVIVDFVKRP